MPLNSGKGRRSWLRATVAPLMVVPGKQVLEGIRHLLVQVVRVAALARIAEGEVREPRGLMDLLTIRRHRPRAHVRALRG